VSAPLKRTIQIIGVVLLIALCVSGYKLYRYYVSFQEAVGCEVTVKRQIPSPHLRRVAVIFEKDCGATTAFNTQVSIVSNANNFSSDDAPPVLAIKGQYDLRIKWLNDDAVQIEIPKGAQIYRQENRINNVTIRYI